jgi:hypothetical protein
MSYRVDEQCDKAVMGAELVSERSPYVPANPKSSRFLLELWSALSWCPQFTQRNKSPLRFRLSHLPQNRQYCEVLKGDFLSSRTPCSSQSRSCSSVV